MSVLSPAALPHILKEEIRKEFRKSTWRELTKRGFCHYICLVCLFTYWAGVCTALPDILKEDNKEGVQEEYLELTYRVELKIYHRRTQKNHHIAI